MTSLAGMDEKPRYRRVRFGLRTLFEIIAVVAVVLMLIYYRTTDRAGRYQLGDSIAPNQTRVLDTQTGRLWLVQGDQWYDMGTPPAVKE